MLCTRMRLTERRFRIKSSISCQNIDGDYESRAAISSGVGSPFFRPCAIIKMYESSNGNGKETIKSSRPSTAYKTMKLNTDQKLDGIENTHRTDVHGSQSSLDRSNDEVIRKRTNSTRSPDKAPLIIVSLYLPSEAKTLVPIDIKRDIRRPPSFCQKFQRNFRSNQCKSKINEKPDFILRGKEITETSSNVCSSPPNQDNTDILGNDGDKSNEECMACSACILEIERQTPSITPGIDETAMCFSYDNCHMDSYGNLKESFDISCRKEFDGENDDSPEASLTLHSRPASPDASRIIRITLNNKTSSDGSRHSDEEKHLAVRDVRSATI